jgi:hypothetical protein
MAKTILKSFAVLPDGLIFFDGLSIEERLCRR